MMSAIEILQQRSHSYGIVRLHGSQRSPRISPDVFGSSQPIDPNLVRRTVQFKEVIPMTCHRVSHAPTLAVFVLLAVVPSVLLIPTTSRALASDAPLFQPAVTYESGGLRGSSISVADVNRDGIPDLIVSNLHSYACSDNCFDGSVGVLLGNGDGTFQTAVIYSSGGTNAVAVVVVTGMVLFNSQSLTARVEPTPSAWWLRT
jgi:hypothetical protein